MSIFEERNRAIIEAAKLYYIDGYSQKEIAVVLNVSRATVSRLLNRALKSGVVTITVRDPQTRAPDIANRIRDRYGVKAVYIAETARERELTRKNVGELAAKVLEGAFTQNMYLGVFRGEILYYTARSIANPRNCRIDLVQLAGACSDCVSNIEGVRLMLRFQQKMLGDCHALNAPIIVRDRQVREMLLAEGIIRKTMQLYPSLRACLFEIEDARLGFDHRPRAPWLTRNDALRLCKMNVQGGICGICFDSYGQCCDAGINDRRLGISAEEIKQIPMAIGVSCGDDMCAATEAVLNSGLLDVLIVDEALAAALASDQ